MKRYLRPLCLIIAVTLFCVGGVSCSKKDDEGDRAPSIPEITSPMDTYLVSLYSLMSGGLSFYDYSDDGRLLSITPVEPFTMQLADTEDGISVVYTYSDDGKLIALNYLSYDMILTFGADGRPTEANYSDSEGDIKIEFEYGESGRIKKETVYNSGELFVVNEYNDIGMLCKESMSLVGEATYRYTKEFSKTEFTLSYSESMLYTIKQNEKGLPTVMNIITDKETQTMLWEYSAQGLCDAYVEHTANSQTRYEHKYDPNNRRIETISYYSAVGAEAYVVEKMEFAYEESGKLSYEKYSFLNDDGKLWSVKENEYKNGLCVSAVEEEYDSGVLTKKSRTLTDYNSKGLVERSENVVSNGEGTVESRYVDLVEYDDSDRIVRLTSENYGVGNAYDGKTIESYEYFENGAYKVITSIYGADGELLDESEDTVEPE